MGEEHKTFTDFSLGSVGCCFTMQRIFCQAQLQIQLDDAHLNVSTWFETEIATISISPPAHPPDQKNIKNPTLIDSKLHS